MQLNSLSCFIVGHLGEAYEEWVHQPIVSKETPQFFANGVIEFLTRTRWWAIPLIWLPVVCWFVSSSVKIGIPPHHLAPTVVAGIFIWTLLEYSLHRFLFHIKTKGYWFGKHSSLPDSWLPSQAPNGRTPTCFPSCCNSNFTRACTFSIASDFSVFLSSQFWNLIRLLEPASYSPALFGGGLLGYVIYDCTHYYLHHGKPLRGVSYQLKRFHMNHHFRIQDKGFGITTDFWDRIFGTLPPKSAKKDS
ncbi:hypothetical protein Pfo_023552 [Paulownia fortunei]|nr:hypothetical protein Pfo_023552 [Paulownia fortunei]